MYYTREKLTDGQRCAVDIFKRALERLKEENVAIVRNNIDDSLVFINEKDIKQFVRDDEHDLYESAVDITERAEGRIKCIIKSAWYPDTERIWAVLQQEL